MKQMTVYRASAGSGKTFTLAVKYIELLLKDPMAYKTTLAVTFTNKATEEMKMRILSQLYGLYKELPDSKDYLDKVMADTGLGAEQVKQNAGRALKFIIHDYNYFCIETIDSFFQRVLRNLARELDLTANLRVELNDKEVEQLAVDRLIAKLTDSSDVLNWIISYIEEAIGDDKDWNVIKSIKQFGEAIFSDPYKANSDALSETFANKPFFREYTNSLNRIISDVTETLAEYAKRFHDALTSNGLTVSDFANGAKGACGYFLKLEKGQFDDKLWNKTAEKASVSAEAWVKKADEKPGKTNFDVAGNILMPLLNEAEECRKKNGVLINSAKVTLRHLHQLRLLTNIKEEVLSLNGEGNRFLLSDTQSLLHDLMKDSDAPFIFEKIGGQLKNIMIDEFQDTSTVQWDNFKKLLSHCMSQGDSQNLIVGDVKQSIYRWRSGDWRLLGNIEEENIFSKQNLQTEELSVNYRSARNIVNFNNEFFLRAAKMETALLQDDNNPDAETPQQIYTEQLLCQQVPQKKPTEGYVQIDFLSDGDYTTDTHNIIKEQIQTLMDNGARQDSIAILVRGNEAIRELAEYLQAEMPEYSFISDEAFHLSASRAVNIIITAMKILCHPEDELSKAQLLKLSGKTANVLLDRRNTLLSMPLRDLSEYLFNEYDLDAMHNEAAYVCAFNDYLSQYVQHNVPILSEFLKVWGESLYKKSVKGGHTEGIRLLTIHKSKGLEYENVIIPYCDWQVDKGTTLWCTTKVEPFSDLPVIPLDSVSIKDTIYRRDYEIEKVQSVIDNMNMLYVAFTRAARNLFVITQNASANDKRRSAVIRKTISDIKSEIETNAELQEKLPLCVFEGDLEDKNQNCRFTCGKLTIGGDKKESLSDNVFMKKSEALEVQLRKSEMNVEFRQSNQSKRFVEDGDEGDEKQQRYIHIGTIMHQLLSQITTLDDLEGAISDFEQEGVIYDKEMNREKLTQLIRKRVEQDKVSRWFSPEVEVFNECTILNINPVTGEMYEQRPDRVVKDGETMIVIDFKFGSQKDEHHVQVRNYMQLLSEMGHPKVEGYLWYVYSNKIVEVRG